MRLRFDAATTVVSVLSSPVLCFRVELSARHVAAIQQLRASVTRGNILTDNSVTYPPSMARDAPRESGWPGVGSGDLGQPARPRLRPRSARLDGGSAIVRIIQIIQRRTRFIIDRDVMQRRVHAVHQIVHR